jgi:hypothetical protein
LFTQSKTNTKPKPKNNTKTRKQTNAPGFGTDIEQHVFTRIVTQSLITTQQSQTMGKPSEWNENPLRPEESMTANVNLDSHDGKGITGEKTTKDVLVSASNHTRSTNLPIPTAEWPLPPYFNQTTASQFSSKPKFKTHPSKTSQASIKTSLDRSTFIAGGEVTGKVELKCVKGGKGLKLGDLDVHLVGYEGAYLVSSVTNAECNAQMLNIHIYCRDPQCSTSFQIQAHTTTPHLLLHLSKTSRWPLFGTLRCDSTWTT